jgi:hypothetical protein
MMRNTRLALIFAIIATASAATNQGGPSSSKTTAGTAVATALNNLTLINPALLENHTKSTVQAIQMRNQTVPAATNKTKTSAGNKTAATAAASRPQAKPGKPPAKPNGKKAPCIECKVSSRCCGNHLCRHSIVTCRFPRPCWAAAALPHSSHLAVQLLSVLNTQADTTSPSAVSPHSLSGQSLCLQECRTNNCFSVCKRSCAAPTIDIEKCKRVGRELGGWPMAPLHPKTTHSTMQLILHELHRRYHIICSACTAAGLITLLTECLLPECCSLHILKLHGRYAAAKMAVAVSRCHTQKSCINIQNTGNVNVVGRTAASVLNICL